MLYKVALTFESVDKIHKFDHWDESYWAVLSCGTAYYALQVCSKEGYWSCGVIHARGHLRVSRFARRTTEKRETARGLSLSLWIKSYGETIQIKAYKQVLSHGAVYYTCILQGGSNF